jgi:hypothetical protein
MKIAFDACAEMSGALGTEVAFLRLIAAAVAVASY